MDPFVAPILLIILGIIVMSAGLRYLIRLLLNLATYVSEEGERRLNFTAGFCRVFAYCPPLGLALILIGVHYLPAV